MRALTTILSVCLFSIMAYAQNTPEESKEKEKSEQEAEKSDTDLDNPKEEVFGDEDTEEKPPETKSFTLDADDAVLEEKVVEEEPEIIRPDVPETTTYHYNNNQKNDEIQTLAGRHGHHGGFGAISFKASEFNSEDILMVGFRAGWIISRAMAIGFEGYGIIPTAEYENIDPDNSLISRAVGGYGGLFLEPIILSNKVVHVTFPVAGGAGWLGYIVDWEQNDDFYTNDLIDDDVFWYVEPGAALELNVARNFRINMGASYRFTKDLELVNTPTSAFDAWNYFLTLKFGSF
jgi:hypothetical protein